MKLKIEDLGDMLLIDMALRIDEIDVLISQLQCLKETNAHFDFRAFLKCPPGNGEFIFTVQGRDELDEQILLKHA